MKDLSREQWLAYFLGGGSLAYIKCQGSEFMAPRVQNYMLNVLRSLMP